MTWQKILLYDSSFYASCCYRLQHSVTLFSAELVHSVLAMVSFIYIIKPESFLGNGSCMQRNRRSVILEQQLVQCWAQQQTNINSFFLLLPNTGIFLTIFLVFDEPFPLRIIHTVHETLFYTVVSWFPIIVLFNINLQKFMWFGTQSF